MCPWFNSKRYHFGRLLNGSLSLFMNEDSNILTIKPIAYARNGFVQKFGIPRQSRENSLLLTRIVFEPEYRVREALRGIEGYSHLWLIWGFSDNRPTENWSPTVRPPRLGGNTREGVFATRSPYRPNPLGLSSVRLLRVEETHEGLTLLVSGADLLNGTPVYDIKPYLSYTDAHPDAQNGFAEATKDYRLPVEWSPEAEESLKSARSGRPEERTDNDLKAALEEILSQNPIPSYQNDPERLYGLSYEDLEVHFLVAQNKVLVQKITHN